MAKDLENDNKTIVFTGSSGGTGTSFLAACTASWFALNEDKSTLLLDLNQYSMDSRQVFDLQGSEIKDLGDIGTGIEEIDFEIIKRLSINLENSLDLILPPKSPGFSDIFDRQKLKEFIERLKGFFEIIIIDMPRMIFGRILCELDDIATRSVIISLPHEISLKNAYMILNEVLTSRCLCPADLIVNKYNLKPVIHPSKIGSLLPIPVKAFIPYDKDIEYLFFKEGPSSIYKYNLRMVRIIKELIGSLT